MAEIKTLQLDRKKYAVLPIGQYKKLLAQIEDLRDLVEVKRRAKEPRIALADVKERYNRHSKN